MVDFEFKPKDVKDRINRSLAYGGDARIKISKALHVSREHAERLIKGQKPWSLYSVAEYSSSILEFLYLAYGITEADIAAEMGISAHTEAELMDELGRRVTLSESEIRNQKLADMLVKMAEILRNA